MDDKRVVGERNTLAVLTALHRFGWLTSAMLSVLVWPERAQGAAMARRTLAKLVQQRLVLRRELPGTACYTLAANGARLLSQQLGQPIPRPLLLNPQNVVHRACANWYAIAKLREGYTVWTEFEIQCGRAPVLKHLRKVPDVLVETTGGIMWVEVENAWKGRASRQEITAFCAHTFGNADLLAELAPDHCLCRIVIAGTNRAALLALVHDFQRDHDLHVVSEYALRNVEIALLPVTKSLGCGALRSFNAWFDFVNPSERERAALMLGE